MTVNNGATEYVIKVFPYCCKLHCQHFQSGCWALSYISDLLIFGLVFSHSWATLAEMDKEQWCCVFCCSWSQSDLLLARGPWDQLLQSGSLHLRGSFTGCRSNGEAQVQQPSSRLRAAAAAGARPGAVRQRDVQRLWLHGEDHWWRLRAEHAGALQQVSYSTHSTCFYCCCSTFKLGGEISGFPNSF